MNLVPLEKKWARVGDLIMTLHGDVRSVSKIVKMDDGSVSFMLDGMDGTMSLERMMYNASIVAMVEDIESAVIRDARVQEALLISNILGLWDDTNSVNNGFSLLMDLLRALAAVQHGLTAKGARLGSLNAIDSMRRLR